MLSSVNIET